MSTDLSANPAVPAVAHVAIRKFVSPSLENFNPTLTVPAELGP
jgi:hypothetical protein